MTLSDKERQEIHEFLRQGMKIVDIADQLGISRETVRKVKNAPVSSKKADLTNFEKTFQVTGEQVTAEELLKSIGSLAPKILKERLEAGELVLLICGAKASAAGMQLEEFLKFLVTLPEQVTNLTELNQQLQAEMDRKFDTIIIAKLINRVTLFSLMYSKEANVELIFTYAEFLKNLRLEDPALFKHMGAIAKEPDALALMEANQANPT